MTNNGYLKLNFNKLKKAQIGPWYAYCDFDIILTF